MISSWVEANLAVFVVIYTRYKDICNIRTCEKSVTRRIEHDFDCLISIFYGFHALRHQGLYDIAIKAHLSQLSGQESPLEHANKSQLDFLLFITAICTAKQVLWYEWHSFIWSFQIVGGLPVILGLKVLHHDLSLYLHHLDCVRYYARLRPRLRHDVVAQHVPA